MTTKWSHQDLMPLPLNQFLNGRFENNEQYHTDEVSSNPVFNHLHLNVPAVFYRYWVKPP
mgnify:FL=1